MLTATSPPLKGAGGDVYNRKLQKTFFSHLPFEGSPRAGAAEYVNNKEQFAQIRYAKVIKKYQSAKKNRLPFLGAVSIVKKYRRIDNLKLLR